MLNVLFVCSKNQWRSPTAEKIYRQHPDLSVRSAGTARAAGRRLNSDDLTWANLIFVMEQKHKHELLPTLHGKYKAKRFTSSTFQMNIN